MAVIRTHEQFAKLRDMLKSGEITEDDPDFEELLSAAEEYKSRPVNAYRPVPNKETGKVDMIPIRNETPIGTRQKTEQIIADNAIVGALGDVPDLAVGLITKPVSWIANKIDPNKKSLALHGLRNLDKNIDFSDMWEANLGTPEPENEAQEIAGEASRVAGNVIGSLGVGGIMSAGRGVVSSVGRFLSAQPGMQTVGAAVGEGARQVAEQSGFGTGVQLGASLLGSLTPAGAQAAIRRTAVGKSGVVKEIDQLLKDADAVDAVADSLVTRKMVADQIADTGGKLQVSAIPANGWLGKFLGAVPGARGTVQKITERTARRIQSVLRTMAADEASSVTLARRNKQMVAEGDVPRSPSGVSQRPQVTPAKTGTRAVNKLVAPAINAAREQYRKYSATVWRNFDEKLQSLLGEKTGIPVLDMPLTNIFHELNSITPSAGTRHRFFEGLMENLENARARNGGYLPYEEFVQEFRIPLMNAMNDWNPAIHPPREQLQRLFVKMTDDMDEAVSSVSPELASVMRAKQGDVIRKADGTPEFDANGNPLRWQDNGPIEHFTQNRELFDEELAWLSKITGQDTSQLFTQIIRLSEQDPTKVKALMDTIRKSGRRTRASIVRDEGSVIKPDGSVDEKRVVDIIMRDNANATMAEAAVRESVLDYLGRAPGGKDAFDLNVFLKNWDVMNDVAKKAIFGDNKVKQLNALAAVARRVRVSRESTSEIGSALGSVAAGTAPATIAGLSTASLGAAALAFAGTYLGSKGAARLLLSKPFTNWLVKSSGESRNVGTAIQGLGDVAEEDPSVAGEVQRLVEVFGQFMESGFSYGNQKPNKSD